MKEDELFYVAQPADGISERLMNGKVWRTPVGKVHFLLVMSGRACVEINHQKQDLQRASFLFLLPQMGLRCLSHTDDFRFEYLFFDFDYLSDFPLILKAEVSNKVVNSPYCTLNTEMFDVACRYFEFIGERHKYAGDYAGVTKGLLFSFISEMSRVYTEQDVVVEMSKSRPEELTGSFFRLLHVHYQKEHNIAFYAGRLCVSDKHLMRTIKHQTGQSFYFWLSDFLIREAKLQLHITDKSIMEISDALCFPNSSFFARFFRKHTGMSPLQFRKNGKR